MYIRSIWINGYKSLSDFELPKLQNDMNVLIGVNNAGKSNILKALDVALNKSSVRKSDLTTSLSNFFSPVNSEFVTVRMILDGFDEKTRVTLANNSIKVPVDLSIRIYETRKEIYGLHTTGNLVSLNQDMQNIIFPKLIYLGDSVERTLDVDFLNSLFSVKTYEKKINIETYATQFIRGVTGSSINIMLQINELEGGKFDVFITDEYGNSNELRNKSSGLQQLAFLSLFFAFNLTVPSEQYILALEEPESNLHAKLQRTLFKHLRTLSERLQIFMTTHSPVFLDRARPESIFHVTRNSEGHSSIVTGRHRNNFSELRHDLGLSMSDSLFLGNFNIVVEGPTEKILFPKMIDILRNLDKVSFAIEDINVVSAEGVDNTPFFAQLLLETGLSTCIIADDDISGRNAKNKLEKDTAVREQVKVFLMVREELQEAEIEDMISDEVLVNSLNAVYNTSLTIDDLFNARKNPHDGTKLDKFSKTFGRLGITDANGEAKSPDKLKLAIEIRQRLHSINDFHAIVEYFMEIDKAYKTSL